MRNIQFRLLLALLLYVGAVTPPDLFGQIKTPFLLRYQTSISGNMTLIANNVLSVNRTENYNGTIDNHDTTSVFVDVDNDTSTFNSTNATLALPSPLVCPVINKVFLYWSAADKEDASGEPDWNFNTVKLKIPGDTSYRLITADDVIYQGRAEHFYNDPYTCFKDITNLVNGDPNGTYWVSNVKAKTGTLSSHGGGNTGTSGGWIIVFIYESSSLPQKNIAIFDGYVHVAVGMHPNPLPFTFSGFQTVPVGDVNVDFLMGSLEGDWSLSGDYCEIQQVNGSWLRMSSALRQSSNFFHSIIGRDGAQFLNRTPASQNTLGFDADKFPLPNGGNSIIGNNQTSATIRMGTDQEIYGLFLIGLVVDVWYPNILALYSIPGMPGGTGGNVNAGDTVTFSLTTRNLGNDATNSLTQTTSIPPGLDYLSVLSPLPPGVTSHYDTVTRMLQFNIPNNLVEVGDTSYTIKYRVKAIRDCALLLDSATRHPTCQVTSTYHGAFNITPLTNLSSTGLTLCGAGNLEPVKINIIPAPSIPVAINDSASTIEDIPISIAILANDTDCDSNININSIWIIRDPSHGTYQTIYNSGSIVYTPDLNYAGLDTLKYRICDFDGLCDTAWVFLNILPVNDPPLIENEHITLCINTIITGNTLINDADTADHTSMICSVVPLSGPSHGVFNISAEGEFSYEPDIGFTGEDQVILVVCDSGIPLPPLCSNDTLFIYVTEHIEAVAGADQRLCMDSTVTLTGNTPAPGNCNWTQISGPVGAAIFPQNSFITTATGLIQGSYLFVYTVTNGLCLSSDTMSVIIESAPTPSNAGPDQYLCVENGSFTSTFMAANTPLTGTGKWAQVQGPGTAVIQDTTSANVLINNLIDGNYLFTWTISNSICPSSTDSVTISVNQKAEADAGPDKQICENDFFTVTGSSAGTYQSIRWSSSGTGIFDDPGNLHPTYTPGTSDISSGWVKLFLTVQSMPPCTDISDTVLLTFSPGPSAFAGPDQATCVTKPIPITGAAIQHSDSITWSHNGQGKLTGTGTLSPVYTPIKDETGIITLTLTAMGRGPCSGQDSVDEMQVTIYLQVTAQAGIDQSVQRGSTTRLAGAGAEGSGSYTFSWEPENLVENSFSPAPLTKPMFRDTTFYLTVVDDLTGCSHSDSMRVTIIDKPINPGEDCIRIYNVLTPNGDGQNDRWIIDCIENFPVNKVTLFDRWGDQINEFENYNNGTIVWKGTNSKDEYVPDGTYYYILSVKNGGTYSGWVYVRGGSQ
ncbi:MAG: Ig-like domain-containing protein [Bacteroidales bacterium]